MGGKRTWTTLELLVIAPVQAAALFGLSYVVLRLIGSPMANAVQHAFTGFAIVWIPFFPYWLIRARRRRSG